MLSPDNPKIPVLERGHAAVLFDMDGTLVDSRTVVERIWREWATRHRLDLAAILAVSHGRRTIDTVRAFATPTMDCEAEAIALEQAEIMDTEGIVVVAGAADLLNSLPADRWAVVTSASRDLALRRMAAAGLPVPRTMVAAEDVRMGKPDPEGYRHAAMLLGCAASDCLAFEDAPAGIEAAMRAGCTVVAITAARPHVFDAGCAAVPDFTGLRVNLSRA